MSTAAGAPSNSANAGVKSPKSKDKGKEKGANVPVDTPMEEDEDEEEEDEDEDEDELVEEEEEEEEEEEDPEIDPSAIINGGRRTRGVKIDYTSPEALAKAGLKPEGEESEDDEDMK